MKIVDFALIKAAGVITMSQTLCNWFRLIFGVILYPRNARGYGAYSRGEWAFQKPGQLKATRQNLTETVQLQ